MYVYASVLEAAVPTVFLVWLRACVLYTAVRNAAYIAHCITLI